MKYKDYTVEDFVADDFFQSWVKDPQPIQDAFWREWLNENPDRAEDIQEACSIILSFIPEDTTDLSQQANEDLLSLLSKIDQAEARQPSYQIDTKPPSFNWYRFAAIFIGFLLLTTASFLFFQHWNKTVHATTFGTTRKLFLPDGSTVTLNGNSKISFANDWKEDDNREVWIEGEAFFQVSKQKTEKGYRKFIVHANNLSIEVLGTQFNVNSRHENTRVVLSEGAIRLSSQHVQKPLAMEPGDFVELTEKHALVHRKVNPKLYSAWMKGELIFEKESLSVIAQLLEDSYGYTVVFKESSIATRRFSGSTPVKNIDHLLIKLSKSHNLQITRQGKTIVMDNP